MRQAEEISAAAAAKAAKFTWEKTFAAYLEYATTPDTCNTIKKDR